MLTFYGAGEKGPRDVPRDCVDLPDGIDWIDAFQPTPDELTFLDRLLKVRVPTLADLEEIESSSRLTMQGRTILMSLPATVKDATGYPKGTPIGFVVSEALVATIRFEHLPSFEHLAARVCGQGGLGAGGLGATVSILEMIVDHLADLLEHIGADLDATSRSVFADGLAGDKNRRPRQANEVLARLLQTVGRNGDIISKVSESLLGISRMAPFLTTKAAPLLSAELKASLETISADATSLREYQANLVDKTQFLLDTLLGLANIEQNNVFRVLTIVSVIGIPPTFFASMYGMNFKHMPELDWAYGYPYGLTLIACSAIVPAVWFKIKGWW